MKKSFLILICLAFQLSFGQKTTTYYFIRHAEKMDNSKNPDLSKSGFERSKLWNHLLSEINFDAIYSTNYKRTIQTVQPIATDQKININIYNPKTLNIGLFIKENLGKKVLIVGHSNTIPTFVNQIIDQNFYLDIEDNSFGNLYIVTLFDGDVSHQLLKLQ